MRLDRYVIGQLLKSTLTGAVLSVVVLLGLQLLRLGDILVRSDVEFASIFQILGGLGLSFTPLVIPIAFLFALLGVFGRMSSDREFVAMSAMGISNRRILLPSLAVSLFFVGLTLLSAFFLGPEGNRRFETSIDEALKRRVASVLRSGTFSDEFFSGMVVFVDSVDPLMQNLERVFIHDDSSFKETVSISAEKARWDQSLSEGEATLSLRQGVVLSQVPEKKIVRRVDFDEYSIHASFARPPGSSKDSPPSLSLERLLLRRKLEQGDPLADPRSVWVELARRLALAFACIFFVPLAFALSLDNSRMAKSRAVFLGLGILLVYWTLYFALVTWLLKTPLPLARTHELLSWLVMWVPNVLVFSGSFYFYRTRVSHRKF